MYLVATALFLLFRLSPGDAASIHMDPGMSAEARNLLAEQYGLNEPLHVQYFLYIRNMLTGNMGTSFSYNEPVTTILLDTVMNTLVLMLTSIVIAFTLGSLIGAYLAWHRNTRIDTIGIGLLLFGRGAPAFWTGMLAIMLFSFQLGWLPTGGMHSATYVADSFVEEYFSLDFLRHAILPISIVTLYWIGPPALIMRNNMIEKIDSDFIEMNKAEGFSDLRIMYLHAARNSLLPVLHYAALAIGFAFGGSVVIERVFSWPGVGLLMFEAVLEQDYPLAQGAFLMIAAIIITMNFLVDILSVYVDPRTAEEAEA